MYDYLYNSNWYLTGTPYGFDIVGASIIIIRSAGNLLYDNSTTDQWGVRPVITLLPNISYTGTGTITDPFVVN